MRNSKHGKQIKTRIVSHEHAKQPSLQASKITTVTKVRRIFGDA